MKKGSRMFLITAMILAISALSLFAFAATEYQNPAEILANLTGKTVEEVIQQSKDSGVTLGALANEAGVLEAFKAELTELQKARIQERVTSGRITQEQADEMIARMQERLMNCTGEENFGQRVALGLGMRGIEKNAVRSGLGGRSLGQMMQRGGMLRGCIR